MEELFLDYENSLLLKEQGFDNFCFGVYINNKFEPRYKSRNSKFKPVQKMGKKDLVFCTAPLYQQAIQWILKKAEMKYPYLSITIYADGSGHWSLDGVGVFLTSDERLFNSPSECIREGIKLI